MGGNAAEGPALMYLGADPPPVFKLSDLFKPAVIQTTPVATPAPVTVAQMDASVASRREGMNRDALVATGIVAAIVAASFMFGDG